MDNGGLYTNYKPSKFGNELRAYEIIQKPRFGKNGPDFDDYQHWYDKQHVKTKMQQSRLVNKLVDRLNPTNRGSLEKAEKE